MLQYQLTRVHNFSLYSLILFSISQKQPFFIIMIGDGRNTDIFKTNIYSILPMYLKDI